MVVALHGISPPQIKSVRTGIDREWLYANTSYTAENVPAISGFLNIHVYIDDIKKGSKYSLWELASRLGSHASQDGDVHFYHEDFDEAYICVDHANIRLKLKQMDLEFTVPEPTVSEIRYDYSKELIGVIEYLHKNSTVGIYKNGRIRQIK